MTKKPSSKRRFIFGCLIAVPFLLLAISYTSYRLGLRPAADTGEPVKFTVAAGENAQTIAKRLENTGLIRSRNAFVTYVNFHGLRPRLKAGEYSISPALSGGEIAQLLAGGSTISRRLVVPEGYRISQIETAAATLGVSRADFDAALAAPHAQAFLSGKPQGVSLEGYLFPDSYSLGFGTSAETLVKSMLDNFGSRVGQEYLDAFAAQGLSLHQALTLASIVEREVDIPADRPIVAQIFLRRFREGTTLGSDVTTVYAAELLGKPFDVSLDSPYNTRRYPGLPPGPICSPGLDALDAVAHPAATNYNFFLTGNDGKTYFAKTYAEHQQNIARHLR